MTSQISVDAGSDAGPRLSITTEHEDTDQPTIEPAVLRAYIARARELRPVLSDPAEGLIQREYVALRQANDEDGPVPTTPRMIECLTRLAEASARIRLGETVAVDDVERARDIYRSYLEDFGVDPERGEYDAAKIRQTIANLKDKGEVHEPRQDRLRTS